MGKYVLSPGLSSHPLLPDNSFCTPHSPPSHLLTFTRLLTLFIQPSFAPLKHYHESLPDLTQLDWSVVTFLHNSSFYLSIYSAGIFKQSMGARNRVGTGPPGYTSSRNWFLGIDSQALKIRAQNTLSTIQTVCMYKKLYILYCSHLNAKLARRGIEQ